MNIGGMQWLMVDNVIFISTLASELHPIMHEGEQCAELLLSLT